MYGDLFFLTRKRGTLKAIYPSKLTNPLSCVLHDKFTNLTVDILMQHAALRADPPHSHIPVAASLSSSCYTCRGVARTSGGRPIEGKLLMPFSKVHILSIGSITHVFVCCVCVYIYICINIYIHIYTRIVSKVCLYIFLYLSIYSTYSIYTCIAFFTTEAQFLCQCCVSATREHCCSSQSL